MVIDHMIKLRFPLEEEVLASVINLYAKEKKLKPAQDLYAAFAEFSASGQLVFSSMIDAYAKCGRSKEAFVFYKEAKRKGHDPGAVAISIVVNCLTRQGMLSEM